MKTLLFGLIKINAKLYNILYTLIATVTLFTIAFLVGFFVSNTIGGSVFIKYIIPSAMIVFIASRLFDSRNYA